MIYAAERETERVRLMREEYRQQMTTEIVGRLKFLDEAGSNVAMTRLYGRAAPGERVVETTPQNYGSNITMLAAISLFGIDAPMTVEGAVDGTVFKTYVCQLLCPTLRAGDVVVMDNLGAPKVAGVREAIEASGAKLIYLPPYSPDLNPIEKCWSRNQDLFTSGKGKNRRST